MEKLKQNPSANPFNDDTPWGKELDFRIERIENLISDPSQN